MSASHFMHYDPLKIANFSNLQVCIVFLQKFGLLHKVNCQGHLNRGERYQRIVECGLMDHNNYLIGSGFYVMKFMTKYVNYMY
jgi:hypothetical protein